MRTNLRGMTLVEMLIAVLLVALLAGGLVQTIRFQGLSWLTIERLDALQRLRVAMLRIQNELDLGTAVLWPPVEAAATSSARHGQLVLAGPTNGLTLLYLDRGGNLTLLRKMLLHQAGEPAEVSEVLCQGVVRFAVTQPLRGLVRCEVDSEMGRQGKVSVVLAGHPGNGFLNERGTP